MTVDNIPGLRVTARRIDQAWHVVAFDREMEHTHNAPLSRHEAWSLVQEIREGLCQGGDLNLALWETRAL